MSLKISELFRNRADGVGRQILVTIRLLLRRRRWGKDTDDWQDLSGEGKQTYTINIQKCWINLTIVMDPGQSTGSFHAQTVVETGWHGAFFPEMKHM
jgi:hypothetical protein